MTIGAQGDIVVHDDIVAQHDTPKVLLVDAFWAAIKAAPTGRH